MRWTPKKRLVVAALLLAVSLALVAAAAWLLGDRLTAPVAHPAGEIPEGMSGEAIRFESDSGATISGWWLDSPAEPPRGTAILLHPLRGSRHAMIGRAQLFLEADYDALLVDLYAHGESGGGRISLGWQGRHDARAAVAFARKRAPDQPIAVIGWSLGGASALLAGPLDVDALVLESVYPAVDQAIENRVAIRLGPLAPALAPLLRAQIPLRLNCSANDLRPVEKIANAGAPILVLAGTLDEHTTLTETRELFARALEPRKLVLFEGANHTDLLRHDPGLYAAEVLGFVDAHLAP